jgi:hypothetical protein
VDAAQPLRRPAHRVARAAGRCRAHVGEGHYARALRGGPLALRVGSRPEPFISTQHLCFGPSIATRSALLVAARVIRQSVMMFGLADVGSAACSGASSARRISEREALSPKRSARSRVWRGEPCGWARPCSRELGGGHPQAHGAPTRSAERSLDHAVIIASAGTSFGAHGTFTSVVRGRTRIRWRSSPLDRHA